MLKDSRFLCGSTQRPCRRQKRKLKKIQHSLQSRLLSDLCCSCTASAPTYCDGKVVTRCDDSPPHTGWYHDLYSYKAWQVMCGTVTRVGTILAISYQAGLHRAAGAYAQAIDCVKHSFYVPVLACVCAIYAYTGTFDVLKGWPWCLDWFLFEHSFKFATPQYWSLSNNCYYYYIALSRRNFI